MVVVAAVLVVAEHSTVFAQFGLCITALTTLAVNASPTEMSCGSSSDCVSTFGSTKQNDGSLPAAASTKNWSIFGHLSALLREHGGEQDSDGSSV